ncbi:MAG TPA: Spy/CpxP family protein refolding chaperone [Blastocatellia bacterium]|nr:Spy/CpxP family protein refolding chaperone [Blastocatellia bacterium]
MKKLNRIKAIAAVIALSIAVAVPVVLAQTAEEGQKSERRMGKRGHHGMRGGARMGGRLFSQLDLTDAQKAQIKQIRENSREAIRPLREEMRAKRQEIRQANQGGTFDEALVRQKLTEIAAIEAKLMAERNRIHQETLAVLTPEQRAKLDQLREQFKNKRNERRSRQEQRTL